jgi:hypothetical protein
VNNTECETLKLRETPKAHEYQAQIVMFAWPGVMPKGYGENVMRYEPKGEKWTILTQASHVEEGATT